MMFLFYIFLLQKFKFKSINLFFDGPNLSSPCFDALCKAKATPGFLRTSWLLRHCCRLCFVLSSTFFCLFIKMIFYIIYIDVFSLLTLSHAPSCGPEREIKYAWLFDWFD
jgi:hypothetical protein